MLYLHTLVVHAEKVQITATLLACVAAVTFVLGVIVTAIVGFAITRCRRCSPSKKDDKCADPPSTGNASINMTTNDAYGIDETPAQSQNYDYVIPNP